MTSGEFAGFAPEGELVHCTSWGAPLWLSWSMKVMVVPGATVTLAGEKLSDWSFPTFWGMTMVTAPAAVEVLAAVLVVMGVDVLVAEDDVVETVVDVDVGVVLLLLLVMTDIEVDGALLKVVLVVVVVAEGVELILILEADEDDALVVACEDVRAVEVEAVLVVVVDCALVYTATSCVGEVIETVRIGLVDPVSAQCENVYDP
jgi:hypothetical protein